MPSWPTRPAPSAPAVPPALAPIAMLAAHARIALLAALCLLPLALSCGGDSSGSGLTTALLTVGGRTVETQSGGAGAGPTVVFEATEGDDLGVWHSVAPQVARTSKVFLYNRAGYGRSTTGQQPRDGASIISELRATLAVAGVATPIVLVAHSDAGLYAELYAKGHADEIAGLVLVEPRHRDFDDQCHSQNIPDCDIALADLPSLPEPFQSEFKGLPATIDALHALGGFGATPVRVITGSGPRSENAAWQALWGKLHGQLAAESTRGLQVFAGASAHLVQIEQPEVVTAAVAAVVAAAK